MENPMRVPRIEKVTINVGIGAGGEKLENAIQILKSLTGKTAVKTITMKRIPDFGIRPKMVVGDKITLRRDEAKAFLNRALDAVSRTIKPRQFDDYGNFSFGIKEHIDIPGVKYDPNLGVIGMDVCVTMERPGYRVRKRRLKKVPVGKGHLLKKEETMEFAKKNFGVRMGES